MNAVFADAGYWIALFNPRDRLHDIATAVSQTIENRSIVTSQLVLMEFLNYYASLGRIFRQRAVAVARNLEQYPNVEVVPLSDEQFEAALTMYAQRQDKTWGLIDCASFLIMQQRRITEALAYDEHFRQAGFTPLLREN